MLVWLKAKLAVIGSSEIRKNSHTYIDTTEKVGDVSVLSKLIVLKIPLKPLLPLSIFGIFANYHSGSAKSATE